jgi:hypothetical protein
VTQGQENTKMGGNTTSVKKTKKAARDLDLELLSTGTEKISWWRLDKYGTDVLEEDGTADAQEEEQEEESDDDDMSEDE